jgi:hypothetical protein
MIGAGPDSGEELVCCIGGHRCWQYQSDAWHQSSTNAGFWPRQGARQIDDKASVVGQVHPPKTGSQARLGTDQELLLTRLLCRARHAPQNLGIDKLVLSLAN